VVGTMKKDFKNTPLTLLQATSAEITSELLRRGLSLEKICRLTGVDSPDELRRLNGTG
jgi:hypothetical protein